LLGDYYLALKTLEPIDLNRKGLYMRVMACHVTLFYYLGFAYLMMRRYVDTIKTFSNILLFINRTKQYHTRSYQYDQLVKKQEQMYALLAIAVTLCPQRIDENVHTAVRERFADKMRRMQRGYVFIVRPNEH
jgi:translation initiation factor 3 subunit L